MTTDRLAMAILWLWRAIKAWASPGLSASSAILFSYWGAVGAPLEGGASWIFWLAISLAIVAFLAQVLLQRPSYMNLAAQLETARSSSEAKSGGINKALNVLLRRLAEDCQMASNDDRVSVYYFHDERFVMLARWSIHPDFRKTGRPQYPIGEGAIGDAWNHERIAQDLPTTRVRWENRLVREHGFDKETVTQLRMHCVSIAAQRIDVEGDPVGVIVFESTKEGRAGFGVLDATLESKLYATLAELVAALASMTPQVESIVSESGAESQPDKYSITPWKSVPSGS